MPEIDIKLSNVQQEALKKVHGFHHRLPTMIYSKLLPVTGGVGSIAYSVVSPDKKSELALAEIAAYDEVQARNLVEFWSSRPEELARFKAMHNASNEKPTYLSDILTPTDYEEYVRLITFDKDEASANIIHDAPIYRRDSRRRQSVLRSLYGFVGIIQATPHNGHQFWYRQVLIPPENFEEVRRAVRTGHFVRRITDDDRYMLEWLVNRTDEIKAGTPYGHNPRFNVPRVMRELDRSRISVHDAFLRLSGILCHTYGPRARVYTIKQKRRSVYDNDWFLPNARRKDAERIIS